MINDYFRFRFGQYLIKKKGQNPEKFHLIGHSLGAQIAGYMAKAIPGIGHLTGRQVYVFATVAFVTCLFHCSILSKGLDPAQPGFEGCSKETRLTKGDANYMEIIHTSGRPFFPFLGFGYYSKTGESINNIM